MGLLDKVAGGKRKETRPKGIVCPYCGAKQDSERWSFSDKKSFARWLKRARCVKCGTEYWIVGSYEKAVNSKKIGM